jgi:hypothetical protein
MRAFVCLALGMIIGVAAALFFTAQSLSERCSQDSAGYFALMSGEYFSCAPLQGKPDPVSE